MQVESISACDWRDAAAYAPLLGADRSLFAWEWLRRDPDYRAAAAAAVAAGSPAPQPFGLEAFERPNVEVPRARPLWSASIHSYVLKAERCCAHRPEDLFDSARYGGLVTIRYSERAEHLLLSDGFRAIRIDGAPGTFSGGASALCFRIEGRASAEAPLLALRRLLALIRTGRFQRSLHAREVRAPRWILQLRTHDALGAGVTQRQIAEVLFRRSVTEPGWRTREPTVRLQVQRLARSALRMSEGGWRVLLR